MALGSTSRDCGATWCLMLWVCMCMGYLALNIAKIFIGKMHHLDCDLEPLIPIFLIASGTSSVLLAFFLRRENKKNWIKSRDNVIFLISFLLVFACHICGNILVYPNYAKKFSASFVRCSDTVQSNCSKNCNTSLMQFSAAVVTIDWIVMVCFLFYIILQIYKSCTASNKVLNARGLEVTTVKEICTAPGIEKPSLSSAIKPSKNVHNERCPEDTKVEDIETASGSEIDPNKLHNERELEETNVDETDATSKIEILGLS